MQKSEKHIFQKQKEASPKGKSQEDNYKVEQHLQTHERRGREQLGMTLKKKRKEKKDSFLQKAVRVLGRQQSGTMKQEERWKEWRRQREMRGAAGRTVAELSGWDRSIAALCHALHSLNGEKAKTTCKKLQLFRPSETLSVA